jgi:hypothetical protein
MEDWRLILTEILLKVITVIYEGFIFYILFTAFKDLLRKVRMVSGLSKMFWQ